MKSNNQNETEKKKSSIISVAEHDETSKESIFYEVKKNIRENNIIYSGYDYSCYPEDISKPDIMKMYSLFDLIKYKKEISRNNLINQLMFTPFEVNYLELNGFFKDIDLALLPPKEEDEE